jgi:hypothetical protein
MSVLQKVPDLVPKDTIGFQVTAATLQVTTDKHFTSIIKPTITSPIRLECGYTTQAQHIDNQSQKGVYQERQEVLNSESAKKRSIDATALCRFPLAKLPLNLNVHFLDNESCEHMVAYESGTNHSTHNAGGKNRRQFLVRERSIFERTTSLARHITHHIPVPCIQYATPSTHITLNYQL